METFNNNRDELLDQRVKAQAIDFLLARMPYAILNQMVFPFILIAVLWQTQNHTQLIVWLSIIEVSYIGRYYFAKAYLKQRTQVRPAIWWANIYVTTTVFMSSLWGAGLFWFFPADAVAEQVFIVTLALGLAAGTAYATSFWINALYAWTYPVLLILSYRMYLEGTASYYLTSVIIILYILFVTRISKLTNKFIHDAIRLRFENSDLIESLQIEKQNAETANQAKTQFLAAASHDLRQPLHALNLFAGLLKHHSREPLQKELLAKVDGSLSALNAMLEKLLDLSRLDAGVLETNILNFKLTNLINELVNEYKSQANEKGLMFHTECCNCYVKSDPVLLEVIIRNLLSNAIRYTRNGLISLNCHTDAESNRVTISVRDTGVGIPENDINKIFSEYAQLNNPERDSSKGLGLGLAIVQRISKLLDSDIKVSSRPGEGSKFSIRVPSGSQTIEAIKTADEINLTGLSIMVIDDDDDILAAMNDMLSLWGCHVLTADSSKAAIEQVKNSDFTPDVILSDYRLREGLNGASAINDVSVLFKHKITSFIITGDTDPKRLREAKITGYKLLHKPLQPEKIKMELGKVSGL